VGIWGAKMLDFRRITLFCLKKRLSKHKMTIFSKHFGGEWPSSTPPPGYAYGHHWSGENPYTSTVDVV